jgi:hypothetical protein
MLDVSRPQSLLALGPLTVGAMCYERWQKSTYRQQQQENRK